MIRVLRSIWSVLYFIVYALMVIAIGCIPMLTATLLLLFPFMVPEIFEKKLALGLVRTILVTLAYYVFMAPFFTRACWCTAWAIERADSIHLTYYELYLRQYGPRPLVFRLLFPVRVRKLRGMTKQFWTALHELVQAMNSSRSSRDHISSILGSLVEAHSEDPQIPLSSELTALARILASASQVEDCRDIAALSASLQDYRNSEEFFTIMDSTDLFSEWVFFGVDRLARSSLLTELLITKRGDETKTVSVPDELQEEIELLPKTVYLIDQKSEYRKRGPVGDAVAHVLAHWADVFQKTGAMLRDAMGAERVPNPYVIGNPVRGRLFVGRDDILEQLGLLWRSGGQCPSVVLFGHRRMGKSSILHNLTKLELSRPLAIVDFNMELAGHVQNTGELLYGLALAIYDAARQRDVSLHEPAREDYSSGSPYSALDRYLKQIRPYCERLQFLITVDEFEAIEQRINQGRLDAELLVFWRGMFQTYPWLVMVFAGWHSLQEMCHNYWHPLFSSVIPIEVSYLSENAAGRLITAPSDEFPLEYTEEAVREIFLLTNGQPFLVQLMCHRLVSRYNQQLDEPRLPPPKRFTVNDVNAVAESAEFRTSSNPYFQGVWDQVAASGKQAEAILSALGHCPQGLSVEEIAELTLSTANDLATALTLLQKRAVIKHTDQNVQIAVELMRRWAASKCPAVPIARADGPAISAASLRA